MMRANPSRSLRAMAPCRTWPGVLTLYVIEGDGFRAALESSPPGDRGLGDRLSPVPCGSGFNSPFEDVIIVGVQSWL